MTPLHVRKLVPFGVLIGIGTLLPIQFAVNTALARQLDSVVLSSALSYSVGTVTLLVVLLAQRHTPAWGAGRQSPPWAWMGGFIGSAYVVGSVVLTRHLGAALATTLVIAAQLITAILMDHFGVLGLPRRPLNPLRVAAVTLALLGLALRFWGLQ